MEFSKLDNTARQPLERCNQAGITEELFQPDYNLEYFIYK